MWKLYILQTYLRTLLRYHLLLYPTAGSGWIIIWVQCSRASFCLVCFLCIINMRVFSLVSVNALFIELHLALNHLVIVDNVLAQWQVTYLLLYWNKIGSLGFQRIREDPHYNAGHSSFLGRSDILIWEIFLYAWLGRNLIDTIVWIALIVFRIRILLTYWDRTENELSTGKKEKQRYLQLKCNRYYQIVPDFVLICTY